MTKGHNMGDRYVVGFRNQKSDPVIWLYSHWGGSDRVSAIGEALEAARPRWSDPSYATRIMMSHIIGDQWSGELGFGISVGDDMTWPDYSDVHIVNWETKSIEVFDINGGNVFSDIGFEVFLSIMVRA
jgi:hypothetical protein